ncbi:MAG: polyphosphate polymerase domain-containing protein [Candidatus Binatia bacterium]
MPSVMQESQTPAERCEYKYRIPPALEPSIRASVAKYCASDPASADGPYLVSSLYFDSPHRVLYQQSRQRRAQRLKLRVRRYRSGPLFIETKRRDKAIIVKNRVAIEPRYWPDLLFDARRVGDCRLSVAATQKLQAFLDWSLRLQAEPAAVVRYLREAYVSRVDYYARVTFDHHLEALRATGYEVPITDRAAWIPFDDPAQLGLAVSGTILELKCARAVPLWMTDLVGRFNLQPLGFSKYAAALDTVTHFPRGLTYRREPARWVLGRRW